MSLSSVFTLQTTAQTGAGPDSLYYVCDGGDRLWIINRTDGGTRDIGPLGVAFVEGIAYWPGEHVIYGADAGNFGRISRTTGAYSNMAEIDGGGTADGPDGPQSLNDVDGLSFDPWTGILWASNRRSGDYDLMFQIDSSTGQYVPDAFGPGVDYLLIDGSGVFLDIDDIAISPQNGQMYTTSTQGGSGQMLSINKYTGAVSILANTEQDDLEGLGYHNDGSFYGTDGVAVLFVQVNPVTGQNVVTYDVSDANCGDPESVASLVADVGRMEGKVWDDIDLDQVIDGGEPGIAGVTVNFFLDANSNGQVDMGDIAIQSLVTDANGDYSMQFAAYLDVIAVTDFSTLPPSYGYTTDNIETASFTGPGQTDANNDFGAATGPDSDGDGLPDLIEGTTPDSDIDGVPDYLDLDSDNDGILDSVEGMADCDYDGVPNYLDLDSDNDGIPDAIEANAGLQPANYSVTIGRIIDADTDGDGLVNSVDNAPSTAYGAGSTSPLANPDTDGDGVLDNCDLDSDDDGILDLIEGGSVDADGDGRYDGFTDANGDGYFDGSNLNPLPIHHTDSAYENANSLPMIADYLDLDSDNDGADDRIEGFATGQNGNPSIQNDCDFDGVIDFYDADKGGVPAPPHDMDNDGLPDYRDLDTDGDGVNDDIEVNDADLNGVADSSPSGNDTDGDGIDDTFDSAPGSWGLGTNVPLQNQDGDFEPDWRDLDDTFNTGLFYYVCDATDQLYTVDVNSGTSSLVGPLGAPDVEAIANWPSGGLGLYGADAGDFGSINTTTGAFNLIGEIDGGGTANGAAGALPLNDVDGLSFDPWTGVLWATERRGGAGNYDLLFQIDPATGLFVPDIFGAGVDYLVIDGTGVYNDVDDLAISPIDGKLYTVGNDGSQDQLLNINKFTGAITVVDALSEQDVEGMAYHNSGTYYGTVGSSPGEWYEIDASNGNMTDQIILACGDPEGNAALLAPVNVITGKVWDDVDMSQTINGGEVGLPGVVVNLYIDVNNDNLVDGGDILIQTATTDANGDYTFEFATTGELVMEVDLTTLPGGYAMTTDNVEETSFQDNFNFGELDANNDFGATGGPDCDGDGMPDFAEGGVGVDSDGDGVDNMCDLDSDNDGILDAFENLFDSDGDGVADYIDLDSDNDGIPDALEANDGVAIAAYVVNTARLSGTDTDGDGLIDAVDNDPATAYGVGSTSSLPNNDNDGDGINDFRDLDSDNDGIYDVLEAGGTDADQDAMEDGFTDGNGDGIGDNLNTTPLPIPNTDGTGDPDYIDWDSDDDGLDDTLEGLSTPGYVTPPVFSDADGDGIWDFWDPTFGGTVITPEDTDGDGTPDYQDLDSDNDSVVDLIEGNDANMDGVADYPPAGTDTDGDGIDDAFDNGCLGGNINVGATDYAEEDVSSGNVNLTSSDVELADDGGAQYAAFYFSNINIAQGATVPSTYIQFQADEVQTGNVNLTIVAEDIDNPAGFTTNNSDVSDRLPGTTASVNWSPPDWNTIGEAGPNQQTPDISSILQEIVDRPGWTAGNDMVIIISGSTSNRRTAEVNPTMVIAGNSYGCATNTPHQDTDGDGAHDWRDIEDDGDGILTIDEVPDVSPANGIPDYLEFSPCGPGFVQQIVPVSGNADVLLGSNLVTNPTNALGAPDANEVIYNGNNNARVDLDLTDTLPAGTTLVITWRKFSGGGNAEFDLYWSATGTGGWNFFQNIATNSTSLINTNVSIPNDARYFRIERDRRRPALDAVAYSFNDVQCVPDWDQDGVPDVTDIDDDNDGIPDVFEVGDKDGDGQIDALDLDSDNDGIPDAVEANAGVLAANMTDEGHYPGGYVATNDANGDGLANDVDPTFPGPPPGVPFADTDSDNDGCPNRCSLDSDGDGITDAVEANTGVMPPNMETWGQYIVAYATANDSEPDGLVDDVDSDAGGTPLPNPDTDGDGIPNFMDLDSDGDLISDNQEGWTTPPAPIGDGNGNCIDDAYEVPGADLPDLDCNGIPDYLDVVLNTAQSGNWNDPNTWVGGVVPTTAQSVVIVAPHVVTLTGNTQTATVTIQPGADLDIGTFTLTLTGSFTALGGFTATDGTMNFQGSGCPQVICGGSLIFHNWEVNNPDGVDADCGDLCWTGVLTLTDGTFDACDANVCMIATTSSVASVSGSGTGDINCDITITQWKDGCVSQDGYFGLASPVTMDIESGWDDDLILTGYTGSDYPNFAFNNTTWYLEPTSGSFDLGWTNPTTTSYIIERGRGYMIWQGPGELPAAIDVVGTPDLDPFAFPVTYTSTGVPNDDGYNLLGNPYPASISWDMTPGQGWTNVGCCDAIFIWDECNQQYQSYAGGVGTNGGTDVIAQSQAFWVKAHIPGASLSVDRNAMLADVGQFRQNAMNSFDHHVFYIDIENGSYYDQIAFRMHDDATDGFDDGLDAFKFFSPDTLIIPNIFSSHTLPNDTMAMGINSIPYDNNNRVIPVSIDIHQAGQYNLDFSWLGSNWPQDMCIFVEDLATSTMIDPRSTNVYPFTATETTNGYGDHRFNVHFSYALQTDVNHVECNRATDGWATVDIAGTGPFDIIWKDPAGNVLKSTYGTMNNVDSLTGIGIGDYIVEVTDLGGAMCSDFMKTVTIEGPDLPVQPAAILTHVGCDDPNSGEINLHVTGGNGPYTYQWAHGPTTQDLSGLSVGTYTVTVTDAMGCTDNESFIIENHSAPVTAAMSGPSNVYLDNGGFAAFQNSSTGATAYVWYFGNDSLSVDQSPVFQYDSIGTYQVMLVAYNGHCSDTAYHTITVEQTYTGIGNPEIDGIVNIFEHGGVIYFFLDLDAAANVKVEVMNSLGQQVQVREFGTVSQITTRFNMKEVESGVYYFRVIAGDQVMNKKIMLSN